MHISLVEVQTINHSYTYYRYEFVKYYLGLILNKNKIIPK